ncbi:MAG: 16S rRNA (cytosine(1402)-N(4))-methyltransferase RsmH [Phycisphaerales bacterium]
MTSERPNEPADAPVGEGHEAVLLEATLRGLDPQPGSVALDLTAGRGGHAVAIAERLGPQGVLVAVDRDRGNLEHVSGRMARVFGGDPPPVESLETATPGPRTPLGRGPAVVLMHGNFAAAPASLERCGLAADLALADLGVASTHLDQAERGFSFRFDGPLDMRLDPTRGPTAADLVAALPEAELAEAIRRLGEEPLARRIARKIAQRRESAPICTTFELVDVVREAYGLRAHHSRMHPATRTFMALRIAVNDELGALEALLGEVRRAAVAVAGSAQRSSWLRRGARIALISFHSLEDRLVKRAFAAMSRDGLLRLGQSRPLIADDLERDRNPRSRSARLRIATVGDPSNPQTARTAAHDP